MQDNETGTRHSGDGEPVAEASDASTDREAWLETYRTTAADLRQRNRAYLAERARDLAGEQELKEPVSAGPWAPLFSSPEAEREHTAAMLPASERAAYLASLPPITEEMRSRPWYGTGKRQPEAEAG